MAAFAADDADKGFRPERLYRMLADAIGPGVTPACQPSCARSGAEAARLAVKTEIAGYANTAGHQIQQMRRQRSRRVVGGEHAELVV